MITKGEKPYLFLVLIIIISVNVYLSCRILPRNEGFMAKVKKAITGTISGVFKKIPDMITKIFIESPIRAVPHKGFRNFLLEKTELRKGPGKAISSLIWAFIIAIFTILVLVPLFVVALMFLVPSVLSALAAKMVSTFMMLFQANTTLEIQNKINSVMEKIENFQMQSNENALEESN